MTDLVFITELGMHPDKFDGINLATIVGACQGVILAAQAAHTGWGLWPINPRSQPQMPRTWSWRPRGDVPAEVDERENRLKVCVGHAKAWKAAEQEKLQTSQVA